MVLEEKELLSAFSRGIRRIICRHSEGPPEMEDERSRIHQHREILFVLRGESDFPLNHKLFDVRAGDVILIDRWIPHRFGYLPSEKNMLYLWFYLFPTHLNFLLHQIDQDGNVSYVIKWVELASDLKLVLDRRWDEFDKLPPQKALANLDRFLKLPLTMLLDEFRLYLHLNDLKEEKTQANNDIVLDGDRYRLEIVEQKTGKSRVFTVPLVIQQYIENYCLRNGIQRNERIFPITERAVQKQLAIVCDYLGYEGISTHSFRKWYATEIYKSSGYDIALVQRLLQHSSAAVTQRYIGMEPQRIEKAIEGHAKLI